MGKTKIPVNDLYKYLDQMYANKWGYIYGTAGVIWTEQKQAQLESKYSSDDPNYGMSVKYGKKWIGHMVSDCSGVMVFIWRQFGLTIPHGSSSMVRQGYIVDCSSVPKPGYAALVDPTPDTPDNKHIGIVGEDGVTVYEAKGTQYGFVKSKTTDSKWTKFGRFIDVDYGGVRPMPDEDGDILFYAKVTTQKDPLRIRSYPNSKAPVVGHIPKGEVVPVYDEEGNFYEVVYEQTHGYSSSAYLERVEDTPPVEPDTEPKSTTVLVNVDTLDVIEIVGRWKTGDT